MQRWTWRAASSVAIAGALALALTSCSSSVAMYGASWGMFEAAFPQTPVASIDGPTLLSELQGDNFKHVEVFSVNANPATFFGSGDHKDPHPPAYAVVVFETASSSTANQLMDHVPQGVPNVKKVTVDGHSAREAFGAEAVMEKSTPADITDPNAQEGDLIVAVGSDVYEVICVTSSSADAHSFVDSFAPHG